MMEPSRNEPELSRTVRNLIIVVAAIGFAFDIYELLMLPLIVRPALSELLDAAPGTPVFRYWVGLLFFCPAVAGGIFGLLGGYLTDRLGRRRVLVWSILIYAGSALAAGFSTSAPMLLFFRCTTLIGVCVEFVAAVAWLAELFPNPKMREKMLGLTQAFSSVGGLMVSGVNYMISDWLGPHLPNIYGNPAGWRFLLFSGVIPAIPLIVIRPFLPESPAWLRTRAAGVQIRRPSLLALFAPQYRRTTLITALMFACSYGAAFGAIQHLPQIVPGLPGVKELPRNAQAAVVSTVQMWQEVGGLVGRCLLAVLVLRILSQRRLLRVFQIPGLFIVPLVFIYAATRDLELLKWGVFLAGLFTVAQFSFWGNYLPRVYPTHLRGTGESFAANIGGRIVGTFAALVTTQLQPLMPGATPASEAADVATPTQIAYAAALVAFTVYLVGSIACFWLPEPPRELPE